jgi:hypothetical protein
MAQAVCLDHLLFLSTLHYAWLHGSPTALRQFYEEGADPFRRGVYSLPGSSRPSALTLVMGWSAQKFERYHTNPTLTMSKPSISTARGFCRTVCLYIEFGEHGLVKMALSHSTDEYRASPVVGSV